MLQSQLHEILKQKKTVLFALTLDMSPKMVIETINVKNAMENAMSVFAPLLITKEI